MSLAARIGSLLLSLTLALPSNAAAAFTPRPAVSAPALPADQALMPCLISAHTILVNRAIRVVDWLMDLLRENEEKSVLKSNLLGHFGVQSEMFLASSSVRGISWVDVEYLRAVYNLIALLDAKEKFHIQGIHGLWFVPWYFSVPARMIRSTRLRVNKNGGRSVWVVAYRNPERFEREMIRQIIDAVRTPEMDEHVRDRWTSVREKPWLVYVAAAETALAAALAWITIRHFSIPVFYAYAALFGGLLWSGISDGGMDRLMDIVTNVDVAVLDPTKDVFVAPLSGVFSPEHDVVGRLAAQVEPQHFEAPRRLTWRVVAIVGVLGSPALLLPTKTLTLLMAGLLTVFVASVASTLGTWGMSLLRTLWPGWPQRPPTSRIGRWAGTAAAFALAIGFELGRWLLPFALVWTLSQPALLHAAAGLVGMVGHVLHPARAFVSSIQSAA